MKKEFVLFYKNFSDSLIMCQRILNILREENCEKFGLDIFYPAYQFSATNDNMYCSKYNRNQLPAHSHPLTLLTMEIPFEWEDKINKLLNGVAEEMFLQNEN